MTFDTLAQAVTSTSANAAKTGERTRAGRATADWPRLRLSIGARVARVVLAASPSRRRCGAMAGVSAARRMLGRHAAAERAVISTRAVAIGQSGSRGRAAIVEAGELGPQRRRRS